MSRLAAYINKDMMEREDVAALMSDDSMDIQLYRYSELTDEDGFRKQKPNRELRLVRVIKGRIDRRDRIYNVQTPNDGHVTDALYIATVYYKDIKVDDELVAPGYPAFRVEAINKIGQSFTEVEIVKKV